ncbi:PREDICTED: uncharacterized protein LOC108797735 [Nanorana parkeri]|uniref:uncharacterized protein LOC108797735 n=1 Tax=Nanorana parkeri TaxID=125878 RepID=UPI0008540210|nr:PREDICTED: uncharacterized protein LOC108797735 [Nanorana parkeri]
MPYAKPNVSGPIKLSLTDYGEVLCSLDIQGFYANDIQMKWNNKETSEPNRPSQNSDGTFSVHNECKLPGSFFSHPDSAVKVSWKHDSMEDWESRELSVLDKEFPWKPDTQDIAIPNLLIGRTATLKCEVSNVFPDVLSVKWLKKEKDSEEIFPVIHNQTYNISELRPEKQKDKTFTYKSCLKFKPSISTEEGATFICRVEHPALERAAEKSTGPLTIKDIKTVVPSPQEKTRQESRPQIPQYVSMTDSAVRPTDERFIVGEIQGPSHWFHKEKVTLYCSVSDCSKDTRVMWMVEHTDRRVEEISNIGGDPLTDSGYMISKEIEESDKEGLNNVTASLILVPSVSKHLGVIFSCRISSEGQTKTKEFKPKSICAKPQVLEQVKTSLCDGGDVLCSLKLQDTYPKQVKITWRSGEHELKSSEKFEVNNDGTFNGHSHCTVPGSLLLDPNFNLHVTWRYKYLTTPQSQVLSWRDPGLPWCPVVEEVPIPHVLIERQNTLQYNISRYFPDAVTVSWHRKEKGAQEYIPLSESNVYQILDIQSQRQSDHTYSCTARLLFKPTMRDVESEIMCRVFHPSLERPIERTSGPLQVQAKPKVRKPMKSSLGSGELILSQMLDNFYPKNIQIEWCDWSGDQPGQRCPSQEKYTTNMNKTFSVTSQCGVPESLLHNPDFRVRLTWRHESMDEEEYKEFSIRDKAFLHNEAALVVSAPTPHRAQLGTNIVLPCSFKVDDASIDPKFLAILWLFKGEEVLRVDNKEEKSHPRMFMNKQDIAKGIASMEIKNVTISDIGQYRCMVIYTPQRQYKDIDLSVYATPSIIIEKVEKEDKTSFARCSVNSFYPKHITVEILTDHTIIDDLVLSEYHTNDDGTYSVNRTWQIPSDESPKMLSCTVHHETLTPYVQKDLQLVYQDQNSTGVVVGGVVAGVIISILAILFFLWYRKRKSGQMFMVNDIESPVWVDGEKTTLPCKASNCTGDVQVAWVIKLRDGTELEVSDTRSGDKEEEQPLLSREYHVTSDRDSQKSKGHVTTKLTFIPSISRHLGSTITCRIIHKNKPVEKTCEIKSIYAKPKFVEPVQFTLSDQGDVQISVKLQKFYPQEMEVSWFSRRGQSEEKMPSEDTSSNSGDTFDLESKCSVSGDLFNDPTYKVIVRWKHQSMEESQSRELSVRDLHWCPKLQNIPIETVFQDDEVILQCRVTDYFPNALAVKWFEKKMGSQDLVEISNSQKYKVPEISSYRMENGTFSSTAVLSYKRSDLSGKGVEFICRVEHPSLDTPIQNSILQYRDTEAPTFVINNIQGPQTWYNGEKVTLYCAASYCLEGAQVNWIVKAAGVTICEIGEDGADVKKAPHQSSGYVAHRERTEISDKEGLQDVTSSLTFTPSISKHQNIDIACKILCDEKVKEKTFQYKYLYAKPNVSGPIKLSLTDSGEVLCSLDIQGFYPSDIQMKWNNTETSEPNRPSQKSDGTFSVHSECKLPGSFFSHPGSAVKVSWKHDSMKDWESRELSVLDKEFPWKPDTQDIAIPNLLIGRTATLKCEVSNVFPDVLSVKWLKKEKDSEEIFPVIHNQTYNISELRPEKQKDKTFTYKSCLKFKPSISTEEGATFICRVEHPALERAAEKSTGPLTIKDEERFIVGEIQGPSHWFHKEKVTLYCSVSDCSKDTRVMWMVEHTDRRVEEISNIGGDPLTDFGYMTSKEIEKSDKVGLINVTASIILVPSVSKHIGVIFSCRISSEGQTKTKEFKPKSICAKPQVLEPVKTSLYDNGDVICSLKLQDTYPKQVKITWRSGEHELKSSEKFEVNNDGTFNGHSHCTVPGTLLLDPNFNLHVTWKHKSLTTPQSQVLSWRDPGLPWCPVVEEVPIPHVLIERQNTLQYNISRYFPDAVTVRWFRKEKGAQKYIPLSDCNVYQILDIQSQRQSDHTYSCTARLLFKPSVKDVESEIICRVSHPSLERPIEKTSGPLQVQAKPKVRRPIKSSLGSGELILSQLLENFYPKNIQIEWCDWSGDQPGQRCPSQEKYTTNMNKIFSVTSQCRVPESLLHNPDFRVRLTWRHESMDEEEYKEFSIRDKAFMGFLPRLRIAFYSPLLHRLYCRPH